MRNRFVSDSPSERMRFTGLSMQTTSTTSRRSPLVSGSFDRSLLSTSFFPSQHFRPKRTRTPDTLFFPSPFLHPKNSNSTPRGHSASCDTAPSWSSPALRAASTGRGSPVSTGDRRSEARTTCHQKRCPAGVHLVGAGVLHASNNHPPGPSETCWFLERF